MSAELEKWMQAALEGGLSDEEQSALNDALRSDPAALEEYCRQMRMHALLAWRAGAATVNVPVAAVPSPMEKVVAFPAQRRVWRWAGWAAAALVMLGSVFLALAPNRATAAVNRVLAAMQRGDRTYSISVIEGDARQTMKNGRTVTYEGAVLHLRDAAQFVLVRPIVEGGRRVTGSDGALNWDFNGNGPVKVSDDAGRFRGGLPGEQQDAPFLDLTGPLSGLKSGYAVAFHEVPGESSLARLSAVKQSRDVRGPREMDITFRRDSGVIVALELRGLPRARGGPDAVRLTLTSETALSADFFHHAAHHEPGREVEDADAPKPSL